MDDQVILEAFYIDYDTPHQLGERTEEGKSPNKWIKTGKTWSSCRDTSVEDKITPGVYTAYIDEKGAAHVNEVAVQTDALYFLPNNHMQKVSEEISLFWKKADKFKEAKVKHKRGICMYGHPGCGKTSMINILTDMLIKDGGSVFYITSANDLMATIEFVNHHLRKIHPEMNIITVIEDVDKFMDGGNIESILLNFLDSADSIDHHVCIATTNKKDQLNDLVLRPSRLDWHIEVELPDEDVRRDFFIKKGLAKETADEWAKDLAKEDFSIADLKELFISVQLLDIEYAEAKKKLNGQKKDAGPATHKARRSKIGF